MTRHLGAGSAHGHRMGALKDMGCGPPEPEPEPATTSEIDGISEPRSWGQGRRIGTMPGGSGEFTEVTSTRNRGLGLSLAPGSRCARVREISTRLGDHGLRLREDRRQSPLPTSRCGMTTCWHHLLSLLVSRETRRCHWTLPRGADSNVGPLPESTGSGSVKSGNQFQNRP